MIPKFFKSKRNIVLSLIVLSLFILAAFYLSGESKLDRADLEKESIAVLQRCKEVEGTAGGFDSKCVFRGFKKLVTKENLGSIVEIIDEAFYKDNAHAKYGSRSCHNHAHVVGEIAYEKGISFSEILSTCSTSCAFGCLHGGFVAIFEESGKNFLDDYKDVCKNLENPSEGDLVACWHIVGHGLTEYLGGDIEAIGEKCLEFEKEEARKLCFTGVSMEYVVGSPGNQPLTDYSAESLINLCRRFPEEYQDGCFAEIPFYALSIAGDEETSIEVCKELELNKEARMGCSIGAGTAMGNMNIESPEKIYSYCRNHGEHANDCVWGAVDLLSSSWEYQIYGAKLCRLVDSVYQNECFSHFGEGLEWWYGDEFRKDLCSELPKEEEKPCLSDPSEPRNHLRLPKD